MSVYSSIYIYNIIIHIIYKYNVLFENFVILNHLLKLHHICHVKNPGFM